MISQSFLSKISDSDFGFITQTMKKNTIGRSIEEAKESEPLSGRQFLDYHILLQRQKHVSTPIGVLMKNRASFCLIFHIIPHHVCLNHYQYHTVEKKYNHFFHLAQYSYFVGNLVATCRLQEQLAENLVFHIDAAVKKKINLV